MRPVRTPARLAARTASSIVSSARMPANRRSISPPDRLSSSTAANLDSNSSSVKRPVSRSASSSRAIGSFMNRSRTVSGSRPSASQNSRKDAKTSVVRTPPKSTSNPRRAPSGTVRDVPCPLGDLRHAPVEQLEERVVGRAREEPLVRALEEDRRLPQRQCLVPVQLRHRPSRLRLVALEQPCQGGESLARGDRGQREQRAGVVAGLGVGGGQVAEV